MIDSVLAVLKFSGLLLSGLFGAYGLLVKFKHDDGKITVSGRNALLLIVASTLVGTVSAAFELYRDAVRQRTTLETKTTEALEAARRTETVVSEIGRTLTPISSLSVSYWIYVSAGYGPIRPYVARFEAGLPNALALLKSTGTFPGYEAGITDENRSPYTIGLSKSSGLSPDPEREPDAFTLFDDVYMRLELFRSPVDFKSYYLIVGNNGTATPDLSMEVNSARGDPATGHTHTLEYVLSEKEFELQGVDVVSNPRFWNSTGKIVSIPDLAGAQLFVYLPSPMSSGSKDVDHRTVLSLNTLVISFGKGIEFLLQRSDFETIVSKDHSLLYAYTFPRTVSGLYKASRVFSGRADRYRELLVRRLGTTPPNER